MNKLTYRETQVLAYMLANLPYTKECTNSIGMARLLGVYKVGYKRGTTWKGDTQLGWDYPDIIVYDKKSSVSYPSFMLLEQVGACNEIWTRKILEDFDKASSLEWKNKADPTEWVRDDDLSAMLCYNEKEKEYGVFYHRNRSGNVEFMITHIHGTKHCHEPFTFLAKMLNIKE